MNDPNGLVQQLLDTIRQRVETKVLTRLDGPGGAAKGLGTLLDEVFAEERAELEARAAQARANGETVQAEMYLLMCSDLLPQAVESLRGRLHRA